MSGTEESSLRDGEMRLKASFSMQKSGAASIEGRGKQVFFLSRGEGVGDSHFFFRGERKSDPLLSPLFLSRTMAPASLIASTRAWHALPPPLQLQLWPSTGARSRGDAKKTFAASKPSPSRRQRQRFSFLSSYAASSSSSSSSTFPDAPSSSSSIEESIE